MVLLRSEDEKRREEEEDGWMLLYSNLKSMRWMLLVLFIFLSCFMFFSHRIRSLPDLDPPHS
jgi:hypothetical protein